MQNKELRGYANLLWQVIPPQIGHFSITTCGLVGKIGGLEIASEAWFDIELSCNDESTSSYSLLCHTADYKL